MSATIVSGATLIGLLIEDGWPKGLFPDIADNQFLFFKEQFVENELADWWKEFLDRTGLKYDPERFDCDDFAELAAALLKISSVRGQIVQGFQPDEYSGIAIAAIRLPTRSHSVNVFGHLDDNGRFYTVCREPQPTTGKIDPRIRAFRKIGLTQTDKDRCSRFTI